MSGDAAAYAGIGGPPLSTVHAQEAARTPGPHALRRPNLGPRAPAARAHHPHAPGPHARAVHAAVRCAAKAAHLRQLLPATGAAAGPGGRLVLFEGCDLLAPGSFDAAVAGCDYVIHMASPFALNVGCARAAAPLRVMPSSCRSGAAGGPAAAARSRRPVQSRALAGLLHVPRTPGPPPRRCCVARNCLHKAATNPHTHRTPALVCRRRARATQGGVCQGGTAAAGGGGHEERPGCAHGASLIEGRSRTQWGAAAGARTAGRQQSAWMWSQLQPKHLRVHCPCNPMAHMRLARATPPPPPPTRVNPRTCAASVSAARSVRRVVVTSSIAAVLAYPQPGKVYTEEDWWAPSSVPVSL